MSRPAHHRHEVFQIRDDCLEIGGMALTRLALRVGRTPFYAYERAAIGARVAALRTVLPSAVRLHYAMKANPMPALVDLLASLVDGIDVASGGELKIALDTRMASSNISFAGPGKSDAELLCAVAADVLINLESEHEMERVAIAGERVGVTPRVAVRINPSFELRHCGMKMGGGARQFGVDAERVPAMLGRIGQLGMDFFGFHLFCGAQNLRADAIAQAQYQCVQLALRLAGDAPAPLRVLNIGGGFGVPYFPGEVALDIAAVGESMHGLVQTIERECPSAQLVLELGRYLVAEAGVYVCRVLERKLSRGTVFLVTDGGMHHHLAASGNFGQVLRKNYPVVIGNKMGDGARECVNVVGPLCSPLDLLAEDMEMVRAEAGDLVVVFQSGAYGLSASPAAFLGHPPALEVLV
jgi:diaminopimelate decarboxylase